MSTGWGTAWVWDPNLNQAVPATPGSQGSSPTPEAAQQAYASNSRVNSLGGDTGSTATGTSQPSGGGYHTGDTSAPSVTNQTAGQGGTGREGRGTQATGTGGSSGGYGSDQGPPSSIGGESARPGAWYGGLADQLYGQTYDVNDPNSFWRDITNMHMGIPGYNSTSQWLASLIHNPYGLAEAMGNTGNMMSNFGALNAMTGIEDNILGHSNMGFDPRALIGSVLQQLSNFDPNRGVTTNPDGSMDLHGNSMLAWQLYDPDPTQMMANVIQFLVGDNGVLKGIMPGPAFTALQNAFAAIGGPQGNFGASIRQDPQGLEHSTPAHTISYLSNTLRNFGIL